jgi:hypothetical protein
MALPLRIMFVLQLLIFLSITAAGRSSAQLLTPPNVLMRCLIITLCSTHSPGERQDNPTFGISEHSGQMLHVGFPSIFYPGQSDVFVADTSYSLLDQFTAVCHSSYPGCIMK